MFCIFEKCRLGEKSQCSKYIQKKYKQKLVSQFLKYLTIMTSNSKAWPENFVQLFLTKNIFKNFIFCTIFIWIKIFYFSHFSSILKECLRTRGLLAAHLPKFESKFNNYIICLFIIFIYLIFTIWSNILRRWNLFYKNLCGMKFCG